MIVSKNGFIDAESKFRFLSVQLVYNTLTHKRPVRFDMENKLV